MGPVAGWRERWIVGVACTPRAIRATLTCRRTAAHFAGALRAASELGAPYHHPQGARAGQGRPATDKGAWRSEGQGGGDGGGVGRCGRGATRGRERHPAVPFAATGRGGRRRRTAASGVPRGLVARQHHHRGETPPHWHTAPSCAPPRTISRDRGGGHRNAAAQAVHEQSHQGALRKVQQYLQEVTAARQHEISAHGSVRPMLAASLPVRRPYPTPRPLTHDALPTPRPTLRAASTRRTHPP